MTKLLGPNGLKRVISKLKTLIAGKADKSHTHTKSQISDFPKSLPASDVAAWAKAATKPGYSWGEISGKPSTFAPSSHTHDDRYYLTMECNDMFQPKGSYAAANHTHPQYLTSHQSLKTINGQSIVGSGNVEVTGREVKVNIKKDTIFQNDIRQEDLFSWLTPYLSEITKSDCTVFIKVFGEKGSNFSFWTIKFSSTVLFHPLIDDYVCKLSTLSTMYSYGSKKENGSYTGSIEEGSRFRELYITQNGKNIGNFEQYYFGQ